MYDKQRNRSDDKKRKAVHARRRGEVETFIVHCAETERIYAVPVDEAPASHRHQDGIRWASDYELPA